MKERQLKRTIIFIAFAMFIAACLQVFQQWFFYSKFEFFTQPWRWWTGHWVHVGWIHYVLNMLAFICLPFIFPQLRLRYLVLMLLALPPIMSFSFYYFYPNIEAYAGLSGVLHGLYVAVAIFYLQFAKERKFALLVLGLVGAKLIWENTFGSLQTAELIGSPVLVEAHLVGAIWGGAISIIYLLYLIQRKKIKVD
ncbi:rhomboid family GlyGly-CTERM serine protease [Acinetobacter calcoaceticus]|uniref:Rhomboid family GlyGly-CTERM serine protease n=1 Tax=Acinetobacter calcoaceticus TaxID=471 RepID=A0A4R1Y3E0_ACICA|nr:rhomboid family GlyGly-CTERM serine protease [Acinetobacter calcoaceticus]